MLLKILNSGLLPASNEEHENLEGFLASIYLTYRHFKDSAVYKQRLKYRELIDVLNRIARRYLLQIPEQAAEQPRTEHPTWLPQKLVHQRAVRAALILHEEFHLSPFLDSNENDFIELDSILTCSIMCF